MSSTSSNVFILPLKHIKSFTWEQYWGGGLEWETMRPKVNRQWWVIKFCVREVYKCLGVSNNVNSYENIYRKACFWQNLSQTSSMINKWTSTLMKPIPTEWRINWRERVREILREEMRDETHMFQKLKELSVCCVWERESLCFSRVLSSVGVWGNRWPDWKVTGVTAGLVWLPGERLLHTQMTEFESVYDKSRRQNTKYSSLKETPIHLFSE